MNNMIISQKFINFGCSIGIEDSNSVSLTNRFVGKPVAWMIANDGTHKISRFIWKEIIARIWAVTTSAFATLTLAYHTAAIMVKLPLGLLKHFGVTKIPETFSLRAIRENALNAKQSTILTVCGSIGGLINPEKLVQRTYPESEKNKTPIFGYHEVSDSIEDPWTISPEMFKKHLQHLYDNNYELCTLAEFTRGHKSTDGKKLAVITFDDSHESQFRFLNGPTEIDPSSAIGVMEQFKYHHRDFRCTATFFINTSDEPGSCGEKRHCIFSNDSEQTNYQKIKLEFLNNNHYEIAAYGHHHRPFNKMSQSEIKKDIAAFDRSLGNLNINAQNITSFAWPHGLSPSKKLRKAIDERFENIADFGFHSGKESQKRMDPKRIRRLFIGPNTGFSQYAP